MKGRPLGREILGKQGGRDGESEKLANVRVHAWPGWVKTQKGSFMNRGEMMNDEKHEALLCFRDWLGGEIGVLV